MNVPIRAASTYRCEDALAQQLAMNLSQAVSTSRRPTTPDTELYSNIESRTSRRPSSTVAGGLPPFGRPGPVSQSSVCYKGLLQAYFVAVLVTFADLIYFLPDRRGGTSTSGYRKDEYNWRYDSNEIPEEAIRASSALENLHLDRKARNLTTSWRHGGDQVIEDDGRPDRM